MSSKQVPEIPQLPILEQMQRLEVWVNGHRDLLEKYRGGAVLNGFGQYTLLQPNKAISPTADMRAFDRLVGDVRVLRKTLAVLHREGCSAAAEELWNVLLYTNPQGEPLKFPFEDYLSTEKEPMVLLMFDPERIFKIMEWFLGDTLFELEYLWGRRKEREPSEATLRFAELLPSLERHWKETQGPGFPYQVEVFRAIGEDVLGPFGGMQDWFDDRCSRTPVAALYTGGTCGRGSTREYIFTHDAYGGVAFAYLLRGVRQDEVLCRIPRTLQNKVATWQFEVYQKTWYGIPRHRVMHIPEEEMPHWQGIYQSLLSRGVAAGHIAVYNPSNAFNSLPDGRVREMKSVVALDNR